MTRTRTTTRGGRRSRERCDRRSSTHAAAALARTMALTIALGTCAAACHSHLTVRRVDPGDTTTPGIRYSLPRPFIQVTPGTDGRIDLQVVCLPDESRTYAIDAGSVLARHEVDVAVERGLLRKVDWTGRSDAFPETLAEETRMTARAVIQAVGSSSRTAAPMSSTAGEAGRGATAPGPIWYAIVERRSGGRPEVSLEAVRAFDGVAQAEFPTMDGRPRIAPAPPALLPRDGIHPVLPSRSRLREARDALERARARLAELRTGGATPLSVAKAMADVAETEMDLERAGALEFAVVASAPVSRILFGPGLTSIERVEEAWSPRPVAPATLDLAPLVLLVSPTEVRIALPAALPAGEYRLILAFEYRPGAGALAAPGAAPLPASTGIRTASGSVEFTIEPVAVPRSDAPGAGAEEKNEANINPEETR